MIRNGAKHIMAAQAEQQHSTSGLADALYKEQQGVKYDRKYFDPKKNKGKGKTLNKQARYNVVFGETPQQASADFRQYTICPFDSLPHLRSFRAALPALLGEPAKGLNAEGNHYYQESSGIGFHGDAERKVVVCLSLGKRSTLRYHWRKPGSSEHESELGPIDIEVGHGDVYVMSEKATGFDWRHSSKYRLVHAAGAPKYIVKKKKKAS